MNREGEKRGNFDPKERKKAEKLSRVTEERQRIDQINNQYEEERNKKILDSQKKKNEQWEEYQQFLQKKEKVI